MRGRNLPAPRSSKTSFELVPWSTYFQSPQPSSYRIFGCSEVRLARGLSLLRLDNLQDNSFIVINLRRHSRASAWLPRGGRRQRPASAISFAEFA
jgi:hypothetical protein